MVKVYNENYPVWNQMGYSMVVINRLWSKITISYNEDNTINFDNCWILNTGMVKGYPAFWYNGKNHIGSRFMYECYNGPITKDLIICHTCDNLKCVNPNHLWEDTTQQNTLDRDLKNRTAKGSKISTSKLKEVDVFNILNNIYLNKYKNTNDILLEYIK